MSVTRRRDERLDIEVLRVVALALAAGVEREVGKKFRKWRTLLCKTISTKRLPRRFET